MVVLSQQATLRRLNKAFAGFFRRVKTAKPGVKPGYPRFKGKARFDSVEWPKDGDGARWLPGQQRVYLQGIGQVKVHAASPGPGAGEDDSDQALWPAVDVGAVV